MAHGSGGSAVKSPSIPDNAPVVSVRIKPRPTPTEAPQLQDQTAHAAANSAGSLAPGGQPVSVNAQPSVAPAGQWQQPCILSGVSSAVGTGVLGAFFGLVPSMLRNRRLSAWQLWLGDGWKSAVALGMVSGAYTWVHCLCSRIRLKDDGWNRGIAGCATGLILGWSGGPMSAAQSCAGLGLISYIVDFAGGGEAQPAHAAAWPATGQPSQLHGEADPCLWQTHCSSMDQCAAAGAEQEEGISQVGLPCAHNKSVQSIRQQHRSTCCSSCRCDSSDSNNNMATRQLGRFLLAQHQQQRALGSSLNQLPPVMWLGQVMAPAYFKSPAALSSA